METHTAQQTRDDAFFCNGCEDHISESRVRLRCLVCPDYDSCADCHVTESYAGGHTADHTYEIYRHGNRVVKGREPAPATSDREARMPSPPDPMPRSVAKAKVSNMDTSTPQPRVPPEAYWGTLITPTKTPSAMFSRLIDAVFAHFAGESAHVLQPREFCALIAAAGHGADEFPPLQVAANDEASPTDLHQLDAWLVNWYRAFETPLEHRLATRTFPPPPPVQPVNGRIRMRDQLLHAVMYPTPPVVPNGMPLLTRRGVEQYWILLAMEDPSSLYTRVNNVLQTVSTLTDQETGRPFLTGAIPRGCFPLTTDPEVVQRQMMMQQQMAAMQQQAMAIQAQQYAQGLAAAKQRMEMHNIVNENRAQVYRNVKGGWQTDANGNRTYKPGYF